ncbi:hypothetical protein ACJIZ3_009268 [Penstemon smallii]|uniref:Uncharacterized protein n=1 Tax=Penstemon smallii TaxID=265156 RepID=A0ABD3TDZ8_9LAMI
MRRFRFSSLILRSTSPRLFAATPPPPPRPRRFSQFHSPRFLLSSVVAADKSYLNPNLWSIPNYRSTNSNTLFFSSNNYLLHKYAHFSSQRNPYERVEIISEENIKPASPTPDNLRTYEVSVLDQLLAHHYMPFVYFFPNNHKKEEDGDDLLLTLKKRRQLLKKSLSETLTRFYPLAGKVKNSREIDCNDDGVYYVEAKINDRLSDFLKQPDNKSIHQFLPVDPNSIESLFSKTYVVMIQVTEFDCGGIAIGLCTSHKIIDGYSHATFLKAWAAATNETSEEIICPSFISPSIFPPNPAMPESTTLALAPTYSKQSKSATRRFVFSSSSIKELKEKAGASTRVMAVTGLIWKCAMAASKTQSTASNTDPKSSVLAMAINLRNKSSPPMPNYLIGNIFWSSVPIRWRPDDDLEMSFIVQRVKSAIAEINNSNFIEKMKGREWSLKVEEHINELKKYYEDENAYYVLVTGMCNGGIYEVDFGWGKPIWVSYGNADTDIPLFSNFVLLMDTRVGNGVEAWVTLSEEDMNVLEKDPEILAFASLNPSPLEIN